MAEDPKSIAVGKRCIEDVLRHGTGSAVAVSNDQRTRANAKANTIADTQSRDGHCRTAPSPNVVFRKGFFGWQIIAINIKSGTTARVLAHRSNSVVSFALENGRK